MMAKAAICVLFALATCTHPPKFVLVLATPGPKHPAGAPPDVGNSGLRDQLTGNGLRMGYLFGKYLRERYAALLPEQFEMRKIYAFASAADRCKQYGQTTMLGVYDFGTLNQPLTVRPELALPPWKGAAPEPGLVTALPHGFQPVPVHSFSAEVNYVFEPHNPAVCPLIEEHTTQVTARSTAVERIAKKFMADLVAEFDYKSVFPRYRTHHQLYELRDYLLSHKYLGKSLVSDAIMSRLDQLTSLSLASSFGNAETLRYAVTGLTRNLGAFFAEAETAVLKGELPPRRLVLAVGHDVNLFLLMLSLGKSSYQCLLDGATGKAVTAPCALLPPPGSSFTFELREAAAGAHQIDFFINGERHAFCGAAAGEACTLEEFPRRLEELGTPGKIEDLLDRYCRRRPIDQNRYLIGLIAFNLGLLGFLLFTLRRISSK